MAWYWWVLIIGVSWTIFYIFRFMKAWDYKGGYAKANSWFESEGLDSSFLMYSIYRGNGYSIDDSGCTLVGLTSEKGGRDAVGFCIDMSGDGQVLSGHRLWPVTARDHRKHARRALWAATRLAYVLVEENLRATVNMR